MNALTPYRSRGASTPAGASRPETAQARATRPLTPRAALAVAGASLLALAVGCPAPTVPPAAPSSTVATFRSQIQHIVFIIKENRSFDNYFGTFPGADGATSGVISTGQRMSLGHTPNLMPQDIGHSWGDTRTAMDNGRMDRFDLVSAATGPNGELLPMTQYLDADLPNYWSYAQNFALGDHMFSSLSGPSFPNHLYTVAAQAGGVIDVPVDPSGQEHPIWGCDTDATTTVSVMDEKGTITSQFPCFDFPTLADSLEAAAVSWRYYAPVAGQIGYIWSALDAINHIRTSALWQQRVGTLRPVSHRRRERGTAVRELVDSRHELQRPPAKHPWRVCGRELDGAVHQRRHAGTGLADDGDRADVG